VSHETVLRPRIFAFVLGLTLLNSWVLFEEVIVDRHGLWKYMPFYRVGDPCVWDLAAVVTIALLVTRLRRTGRI
jgi:hypothetical protein